MGNGEAPQSSVTFSRYQGGLKPHQYRSTGVLLPMTLFEIPRKHEHLESIKEFLISTIRAGGILRDFRVSLLYLIQREGGALG